jgi:hypothetical protein
VVSRTEWDDVYDARERFFLEHFGPIEGDVHKLMNLTGVWPGGCLVQIDSSPRKLWVTSSFGLTNSDMPAQTTTEEVEVKTDDDRAEQWSMRLVAREPRNVAPGLAGYGYEILLLSRTREFWPLLFLNWVVPVEILHDADILGRVREIGAVTVEDVAVRDESSSDFIVAPAQAPLPDSGTLPNGRMHLLVATSITRLEMEFALERGQAALLERLSKSGVGQVSTLGRKSCV